MLLVIRCTNSSHQQITNGEECFFRRNVASTLGEYDNESNLFQVGTFTRPFFAKQVISLLDNES